MASGTSVFTTTKAPAATRKRWAFKARGLVGGLAVVAFGSAAILSPLHFAPESWGAVACNIAGWCLFAAGALMRFWSTLYIGGRKLHTLANEGPYSVVRNPLYLGTFLMWSAAAVYLQSVVLAVGVVAAIAFYRWFAVPGEEKQLLATLGQPYELYCRETPRFIPRFSQFRSPQTLSVTTLGLWLECRRASRWVWLPILAEVINHLRAASWWPHPWNLP